MLKKIMDIQDRIFLNSLNLKKVSKTSKVYKELEVLIEKDKKELEELTK